MITVSYVIRIKMIKILEKIVEKQISYHFYASKIFVIKLFFAPAFIKK